MHVYFAVNEVVAWPGSATDKVCARRLRLMSCHTVALAEVAAVPALWLPMIPPVVFFKLSSKPLLKLRFLLSF